MDNGLPNFSENMPCNICANGPSMSGCLFCYPPEYPKFVYDKSEEIKNDHP